MGYFLLQLCYKEKYYNSRGTLLPMPITPELMHCFHVNEINSDVGVTHTRPYIYCGVFACRLTVFVSSAAEI